MSNERTHERAVAETQAQHAVQNMLSRIALKPGDKIDVHVTVASPQGVVATDRRRVQVQEPMLK